MTPLEAPCHGRAMRALAAVAVTFLFGACTGPSAATKPTLPEAGLGERAFEASCFSFIPEGLVKVGLGMKDGILGAMGVGPEDKAVTDAALAETWTGARLLAATGSDLERRLPAATLDAARARMTPRLRADLRELFTTGFLGNAGHGEQLEAARALPDAAERTELARRLVRSLPPASLFGAVMLQPTSLLADLATVHADAGRVRARPSGDTSESERELRQSLEAAFDEEKMVSDVLVFFGERPTADLEALTEALEAEPVRALQVAAGESLAAGADQLRAELRARLQRDLSALPGDVSE